MKFKSLIPPISKSLNMWLRFGLWAIAVIVVISNLALRLPPQFALHDVLGTTTDTNSQRAAWQEEQKNLETQHTFWTTVVEKHPEYRDGYLQLARLSFLLGKKEDIQGYVEKAKQIDPTIDYSSYEKFSEE